MAGSAEVAGALPPLLLGVFFLDMADGLAGAQYARAAAAAPRDTLLPAPSEPDPAPKPKLSRGVCNYLPGALLRAAPRCPAPAASAAPQPRSHSGPASRRRYQWPLSGGAMQMRWPPRGRGQEVRALPWVLGVRAPLSIGGSYLPALELATPFHICIGPGCGLGAVGEGGSTQCPLLAVHHPARLCPLPSDPHWTASGPGTRRVP